MLLLVKAETVDDDEMIANNIIVANNNSVTPTPTFCRRLVVYEEDIMFDS